MSVELFDLEESYEITRIHGGDIRELTNAVLAFAGDPECSWRVEEDTIVLVRPMGSMMSGRNKHV